MRTPTATNMRATRMDDLIRAGCNLPYDANGNAVFLAVVALLAYVEAQPCYCTVSSRFDPCQRCTVLGQRDKERVLR